MRGALALILTLLLLQALLGQANHAITGFHVYLFCGGLFVAYGALMLRFGPGLAVSLVGGLLCDATAPVAFGTHAFLFAVAHVAIQSLRNRLPREETAMQVVVALAANLGIFAALTVIRLRHNPAPGQAWERLIADLGWSETALALVAPWFFAVQARALAFAGESPS
jgi:rod shape-determining protein MreD